MAEALWSVNVVEGKNGTRDGFVIDWISIDGVKHTEWTPDKEQAETRAANLRPRLEKIQEALDKAALDKV